MNYTKIDINQWPRREYFNHYNYNVPCTYSMSVKLDITKIKETNKKLYPTMIYLITSIVNKHDEFKTTFDKSDNLVIYDEMIPCYTIFHPETETFSNIWTEYHHNYSIFLKRYENDLKQFKDIKKMDGKPNVPANHFPISMIPWVSFEGFNLNLQKGYNYLLPIFTMGKYYEIDGKILLPLAIQVHHAVCDGYHLARFINELQDMINSEKI